MDEDRERSDAERCRRRHVPRMFSRLHERHQHRDEHHAGTVDRRHDERPRRESEQSGRKPDPQTMPVPVGKVIDAPRNEDEAGDDAKGVFIDRPPERDRGIDHDGDRGGVAERDGNGATNTTLRLRR